MNESRPKQDPGQLLLDLPSATARAAPLPSLNEQLAAAGYATAPAGFGREHVLRDGRVVFTGRAHEVAAWLAADPLPW